MSRSSQHAGRTNARASGPGRIWAHLGAAALVTLGNGCSADYGDPGPSWGGFEFTSGTPAPFSTTIVLVVDDRTMAEAIDLRAGIGDAVRHIGGNRLKSFQSVGSDPAVWHAVDIRIVMVSATSPATDAVASEVTNPGLAWTTNRATPESLDAWVRAVEDEVKRMSAPPGAPFRPLERARDVVQLLEGQREARDDGEKALVARQSSRRALHVVAVSIVTTSDDESPESIPAYDLDGDRQTVPINVVTPEGQGRAKPDSGRFPRLSAWAATSSGAIGGCDDDIDSPLQLFQESCGSTGYSLRCETRSIEEISPGIGRCYIEITTIDPPRCDASRGWADPKDAHGVRRPRTNAKGEHVCEVLLVALEVMDACVHDPSCADCGSGWCLSEVRPWARFCPATPPKVLRFVGGALPEPGSIHVTCLEPR